MRIFLEMKSKDCDELQTWERWPSLAESKVLAGGSSFEFAHQKVVLLGAHHSAAN
jgi:hypothetical protein